MYCEQPKKLIPLFILQILKQYTDEDHRLSQKDILDLLEKDYEMKIERKAIKSNLLNLEAAGYKLHYNEVERNSINRRTGEKEDASILTDFYLERTFNNGELRLLVDSVLSSKNIPPKESKEIIKKIEDLSNQYFHANVRHVSMMPTDNLRNEELFHNIKVLNNAIGKEKQVSFIYNSYGTDLKLHPRTDASGKPRTYIINPYQMAVSNSRYYLICSFKGHDEIAHCRIDRITNIKILDEPVRNREEIPEMKNGFNFPKHMAEHIYMFSGPSIPIRFKAKKRIINDIIDWFGKDLHFSDETEDSITVSVHVNELAMRCWALQYALNIQIISPESLKEQIKEDLKFALEQYEQI